MPPLAANILQNMLLVVCLLKRMLKIAMFMRPIWLICRRFKIASANSPMYFEAALKPLRSTP